ncbi:hypothetical protein MNBD_UNCLBAC01-2080 [hydrothermal vent metagenome]|uniref:Glycosyltransferase n=1 Tax=hydrothermal vent metagenome TaxID=652676 RepID=A0A3B1DJF7_9ZZZZ
MNIILLSTHLNTGGITSYLLTLAKGLVQRGHQVHVITSGGNMEEVFLSLGVKVVNLNIRTKSELSPKLYKALWPLRKYIKENNIDVVHTHTRITQVMGSLVQRVTECSVVSTCHGFFKTRLSRHIFPCWGQKTIAISSAVKKHLLEDFNVKKSQIELIESGIDLQKFLPVEEKKKGQLRKKLGLDGGSVLGIVARLSDVKGQDILVEAMSTVIKKFPTVKLLLVGEGKLEPLLREMVENLDLEDHVLFFPVVDQAPEMLTVLDVFVNPSRQEGLGISVMEAQAVGLSVVASNVGGIPSLIEDGKTGVLVDSENSKILAEAIIDLLQHRDKQKKIGLAAREHALKNYSAEVMVDKILQVYQEVIC